MRVFLSRFVEQRATLILGAVMLSGCMHAIGISPTMQCAARDMALEGVQMETGHGFAIANNGRWAVSNGYTENVSCKEPATRKQRCEIVAMQAALRVEREYDPAGPNVALFIGYSLFILPGIIMYFGFDSEREGVIQKAADAAAEAGKQCWSDATGDAESDAGDQK